MNPELLEDIYPEEEFLIADGFDDAILGVVFNPNKVVYSTTKCLEILCNQGMTDTEAMEYFEFNVAGAYVGEQTPIFVNDIFIGD